MQFDYIIKGSDSAGPFIQMPAALSYPMNMKRYDWRYVAEPEDTLDGRAIAFPCGRVIGGSGSINGMIYVRGHTNDPMAVVDSECRVHSVDGVRVADSSIFTRITNGNLNAPTIMVAEKAADRILGGEMFASSYQDNFIHLDWKNSQR